MSLFCAIMFNIAFSHPFAAGQYPAECWRNPGYEPAPVTECDYGQLFGICTEPRPDLEDYFHDLFDIGTEGENSDEQTASDR